jgi:glycosyltransferase involved in cell wall biosynthesis
MLVRQFSRHGGLELYCHKVVEGLLASGVRVTVVCQENDSDFEHAGLDFKMITASKRGNKRSRLAALCQGANQALAQLEGVDLMHSQHCPTGLADVVTFHNHSLSRLSRAGLWWERLLNENKRRCVPAYRLRDRQDEELLRRARCLIFPAEVMKEDFFSAFAFLAGPPAKPYVVAHPGAAMASASPAQTACVSAGTGSFNFLFVGRGFRKKGLDVLLSACRLLKQKNAGEFRLLIAGLHEKPLDRMRLSLLGLADCVKYLGFQKDMDAVYSLARSIILPSRLEPFGMAPVQAMQRGLVPVVSRVSGVAEVLEDGRDSLILNNHLDARELACLMEKLMREPELLKKLSANALVSAEKVSWQETVAKTLEAYEIALAAGRSGRRQE